MKAMVRLKRILSIVATNWVHIIGFYITTYASLILFKIIGLGDNEEDWQEILLLYPLTIPLLFFAHGLIIIGGFYGAIILFDLIGFSLFKNKITEVLIIEWVVIIIPFVYWAFVYEYWLWITPTLSFLGTQFIRKQRIERIIKETT